MVNRRAEIVLFHRAVIIIFRIIILIYHYRFSVRRNVPVYIVVLYRRREAHSKLSGVKIHNIGLSLGIIIPNHKKEPGLFIVNVHIIKAERSLCTCFIHGNRL